MDEHDIPPPPERHKWDLHTMQVGQSRFFPAPKFTGPQVRAAAKYAAKKHGGRYRVSVSIQPAPTGALTGHRVWRLE